jgi:RHS repeat-associated protein
VDEADKKGKPILLDYDARGNLIQKGDSLFTYNFENQLVRVSKANGGMVVENFYNSAGQRVIQTSPEDTIIYIDGIFEVNKTHVSRHVWAGPLLLSTITEPLDTVTWISRLPSDSLALAAGTGRLPKGSLLSLSGFACFGLAFAAFRTGKRKGWLAELNNAFSGMRQKPWQAAVTLLLIPGFLTSHYGIGNRKQVAEDPQSYIKWYFYHSNHLGSVNVVTDETGKVVERRDYKPYGDRFEWAGPNEGPRELLLTFGGHYFDDQSGLYYLGARHYDPQLGRFLTADTQIPDPQNPKTLNRYAFAGGNPIRYIDPTGHAWWDFLIAAFVFIAAIVLTVVSCGALAGLAVALIAVGAALIAASISLAMGLTPSDTQFWENVVTGLVIGAVVSAGIIALPVAFGTASFSASYISSMALVGAAFGAIESVVSHFCSGGSADNLLGMELFKDIIVGGITGAIGGAVMGKIAGGISKLAQYSNIFAKIGKALLQGIRFTMKGAGIFYKMLSLGYAAVKSALNYLLLGGGPAHLGGDLFRRFVAPKLEALATDIVVGASVVIGLGIFVITNSQNSTESLQTMPAAP